MNTWIKNSLLVALSAALLAGTVQAQPRPAERNPHSQHDAQRGPSQSHGAPAHRPAAPQQRHDAGPRGPQAHFERHDFRSGQRLPNDYRGHHYVVDNWRAHGLKAPPRGQHWVQVGGDYLLVSIATGVIASVLLGGR
ncbi:hypothetical protein CCO03_02375 [Comamonas serinivorans]|uniref:Integral membrane-like protein n=1 Tax=Comamonas serinivorans TaxID=1082851 RepID=A0A1Y0EJ75_9BURK|nr:RcnB family protein [Comamonas serinivorans]ARU03685.1 hypothetical protein CCO03_02375 [Comamonas serinivorans]